MNEHRYQLALLVSALSFQRAARNACNRLLFDYLKTCLYSLHSTLLCCSALYVQNQAAQSVQLCQLMYLHACAKCVKNKVIELAHEPVGRDPTCLVDGRVVNPH